MANLLKPSVDQIVFGSLSRTEPVRRRSNRDDNGFDVGFLGQDEDREPVATRIGGLVRAIEAALVLVTGFASVGRI
jgi:hypothetical protein